MDSQYIRLLCPARVMALGQKKRKKIRALFLGSNHMRDHFSGWETLTHWHQKPPDQEVCFSLYHKLTVIPLKWLETTGHTKKWKREQNMPHFYLAKTRKIKWLTQMIKCHHTAALRASAPPTGRVPNILVHDYGKKRFQPRPLALEWFYHWTVPNEKCMKYTLKIARWVKSIMIVVYAARWIYGDAIFHIS